jgi:hypothetical protein
MIKEDDHVSRTWNDLGIRCCGLFKSSILTSAYMSWGTPQKDNSGERRWSRYNSHFRNTDWKRYRVSHIPSNKHDSYLGHCPSYCVFLKKIVLDTGSGRSASPTWHVLFPLICIQSRAAFSNQTMVNGRRKWVLRFQRRRFRSFGLRCHVVW